MAGTTQKEFMANLTPAARRKHEAARREFLLGKTYEEITKRIPMRRQYFYWYLRAVGTPTQHKWPLIKPNAKSVRLWRKGCFDFQFKAANGCHRIIPLRRFDLSTIGKRGPKPIRRWKKNTQ